MVYTFDDAERLKGKIVSPELCYAYTKLIITPYYQYLLNGRGGPDSEDGHRWEAELRYEILGSGGLENLKPETRELLRIGEETSAIAERLGIAPGMTPSDQEGLGEVMTEYFALNSGGESEELDLSDVESF